MQPIRTLCLVWGCVIMIIMWSPITRIGGLDLTSEVLQGSVFAVGAMLFALADRSRPNFFALGHDLSSFVEYLLRFRGHVVRIATMLLAFDAALEFGKYVSPWRVGGIVRFAENGAWILVASALAYVFARLVFTRLIEHHLRSVASSLGEETVYSGVLRDALQTGYGVCARPSLSPSEKVEQIREILSGALAAPIPAHSEALLDRAYGPRQGRAAASNPAVAEARNKRLADATSSGTGR